jgi:hypothetical protein
MDKALQDYTCYIYSHGSEYLKESSQIMIQDLLVISQKQFAKPQIFTRILVQPFIHTPMDNQKE